MADEAQQRKQKNSSYGIDPASQSNRLHCELPFAQLKAPKLVPPRTPRRYIGPERAATGGLGH
jgi:hypothetical protein